MSDKTDIEQLDIAGKEYWDKTWANSTIPSIIDPHDNGLGNVINRANNVFFHEIFEKYLGTTKGKKLLEVGCGNSAFLPYMNKEFGFDVYGLDYSEVGCEMTRKAAEHYGVEADIVCCDLFDPVQDLKNKFDVVISMGVIEHFDDTSAPCRAMYDLVKDGGIILTTIPNFSRGSVMGWLQKKMAPEVYDIHVPLDVDDVIKAHEESGFKTRYANYYMYRNYGVINYGQKHSFVSKLLIRLGKIQMLLKSNNTVGSKSRSPYIAYVGEKI